MNVLVGHESVLGLLERSARVKRPAHAYVFTGLDGIGKKMAAVRFACLLNCPDPTADPHGSCPVCSRIRAQTHPDFLVEKPERGMIRIDRIRYLKNFLRYPPAEGTWRIVVIDDAHLMNRAAQNAILKTLEEPPAGRMVILVTSKPHLLLSTVRSRCRHIGFGPIALETLAEFLQQEKGMSPEKSWILAGMGCGSISQALEMDTPSLSRLREQMISTLSDPGSSGIRGLIELSAHISSDRKRVSDAIHIALTWIQDLLRASVPNDHSTVINSDFAERIRDISSRYSVDQMFRVYDEILNGSELIESDINVNRNLITDIMFLRIARILVGPDLGTAPAEALRS
ncbi:MAG: DNA polymerase III subunit delta' [Desulfomonile sp.]